MSRYDKKFFMFVVTKQNKEDYKKKKLNNLNFMLSDIRMFEVIDKIMTDCEKITWDEFYNRVEHIM